MSPSSLLYPGPDDLKDSVQVVRGGRAFGLESLSLLGPTGHLFTMSASTPAFTTPSGEAPERLPLSLSLFGVTRKAKKSANLPEGRTRGLGQLHRLGLAQFGEASLSRGATPLPAPRTAQAGGRPSDQRSGLPRKLQTEALGAGSRGGRRGAQHAGGEAANLFKDPDYFPLNEKQQQQQQLFPLLRAPRLLP